MKAISLWQPWASLWVSGIKIHETRSWPTRHRGWLLVHASQRLMEEDEIDGTFGALLDREWGPHWWRHLPMGALIGAVNIVDCVLTGAVQFRGAAGEADRLCGDFTPGRWAWRADRHRAFVSPVRHRGRQGLFVVPEDILPPECPR